VESDEPLVTRHWAIEIDGDGGHPLFKQPGVAIISTDRKAIVAGNDGGWSRRSSSSELGRPTSRTFPRFGGPNFSVYVGGRSAGRA
jgi:hypothetical protein